LPQTAPGGSDEFVNCGIARNADCGAQRNPPEKARGKFAPATATLTDGLKCSVNGPSGETMVTDMPKAMGGEASAPNPGWYFRASIAACCSTAIAMNAARRGINLTALEVTVEADGDNRGLLAMDKSVSAGHAALRTNVKIASDNATAEQLRTLFASRRRIRRSAARSRTALRTRCGSTWSDTAVLLCG
jgi:uncharacterized OsmC-like protein